MISPRDVNQWLNPRLIQAEQALLKPAMNNSGESQCTTSGSYSLAVDLGTCNVVSIVIDEQAQPIATRVNQVDVVRDGIVWDFFGATEVIKQQIASLQQQLGITFSHAATSYPPGTDPRISVNVLEAVGLEVSRVIDEPSAVADMMQLEKAAVVDIGGGTTGIAVIEQGKVIYSGDEATGGHHVSLAIAGNLKITVEQAEEYKKQQGKEAWSIVKPVFEKMVDIVEHHLAAHQVEQIYLSGGSCALPGVAELFQRSFPKQQVILPALPMFVTPLAIAVCGMEVKDAK